MTALAGGFGTGPQGARVLGLGCASTAYINSIAGLSTAPGLPAQWGGSLTRISLGGIGQIRRASFIGQDTYQRTDQDLAIQPGGDFYAARALSKRVSFGSVLTTPYGYHTKVGTTLMLPYSRDACNPLRDADVLDNFKKLQRARAVLDAYNADLENLAHNIYRLPEVEITNHRSALDLDGILFNNVADIISVNGVVYSLEPVRGNFFSLDYYSLTPRGNGLVANTIISAINKSYRANIPAVDVNNQPTVAQ
ncbi:hypothetical protein [Hymenobacter sedentarius]|uniref:hypothetical protein n=1 Tax=Hymenobacter sedentarius TaxID=1411621 RepID=UPI0012FDBA05|nr:hypothetical protein [Hymenobacter sedentarius]